MNRIFSEKQFRPPNKVGYLIITCNLSSIGHTMQLELRIFLEFSWPLRPETPKVDREQSKC